MAAWVQSSSSGIRTDRDGDTIGPIGTILKTTDAVLFDFWGRVPPSCLRRPRLSTGWCSNTSGRCGSCCDGPVTCRRQVYLTFGTRREFQEHARILAERMVGRANASNSRNWREAVMRGSYSRRIYQNRIPRWRCTPIRLRKAVEELLRNPRYRENAPRIGAALARCGGAERAAELVEQKLAPVTSSIPQSR
jgi:hypothetical protein